MIHEHGPIVSLYARHGSTVLNSSGCFRGMMDLSLDAQGIQDAHRLAEFLKDYQIFPIVVLSDMKRARETAHIIGSTLKSSDQPIQYRETPELRALNVGKLSGQKRTAENEAIVAYHADNPDVPFEGGESLNDFRTRVHPIMEHGIEVAIKHGCPVLFVAHSSVIHEVGQITHKDHTASLVKPGGVTKICACDGCLCSEPIFRPDNTKTKSRVTVS